jgi:hypothetical protein
MSAGLCCGLSSLVIDYITFLIFLSFIFKCVFQILNLFFYFLYLLIKAAGLAIGIVGDAGVRASINNN